jgi:dTMP kinase
MTRTKNRASHDRIEQEKIDFFERVRAAYLARAQAAPTRFKVLDASKPLAVVQGEIKNILDTIRQST